MRLSQIPSNVVQWTISDREFQYDVNTKLDHLIELYGDMDMIPLIDTDLEVIGLKSHSNKTRIYW